jgi:hypothetical protein
MTIGLLMVRNLLVLVAIKEALESPMELLLDNNLKKVIRTLF